MVFLSIFSCRTPLNFTYSVHELIPTPEQAAHCFTHWGELAADPVKDPPLPFERPGLDLHPDVDGNSFRSMHFSRFSPEILDFLPFVLLHFRLLDGYFQQNFATSVQWGCSQQLCCPWFYVEASFALYRLVVVGTGT